MKYSYNWIKELTKTNKNPDELAKMIGLRGFELEEKEKIADRFNNVVVGEILEIKDHPNADKLQLARVNVGEKELDIVCGAPNIEVGQKVPVALVGAILPLEGVVIKESEIRGEKSHGMLCAQDELDLGKDHSGIMTLDKNLKTGTPLAKALNLGDTVLDFDILPNRAHDCLSHEGMAREICAMEGKELRIMNYELQKSNADKKLTIEIKDKELCPRYIGAVLENIKVGPSPDWMQARLVASGMEPINNVVDITNYVMLEVGSPLHAFDFDGLESGIRNQESGGVGIVVRKAKKDEKLELLDGTKLDLNKNDLVICNDENPMALAGIKGGKDSGISDTTETIVLEAANFQALSIRKSRQKHALLTESQARFEKGIAPKMSERAAARAIELFKEHAGAKLVEVVDVDHSKPKEQEVVLNFEKMESLIAHKVDSKKALGILKNLGFEIVKEDNKKAEVKVPFWRLDIEGPEDLMEEVGRIIGYEKIEEKPIMMAVEPPKENEPRKFDWKLSDTLIGLGFDEVRNYSFYGKTDAEKTGLFGDHIELENPLSEDLAVLRKSLLVGILKNLALNMKYFSGFSIFEIGRVYEIKKGKSKEISKIAGAVFCSKHQKEEAFYLAKGKIESLFRALGMAGVKFRSSDEFSNDAYYATRAAKIMIGEKEIGEIGQVSDKVAKNFFIKKNAVVFELDFETLRELSSDGKNYVPLRKYPMILRDLSMYVGYQKETSEVIEIIKKAGGENLLAIELFDVYVDKKNNQKSLAFHLSFGKDDCTMKSEEADKQVEKIMSELEKNGAKVRK